MIMDMILIKALPGTPIDRFFWYLWFLYFAVMETIGIFQWHGDTSLTRLTLATVPKFILAMFLGWLVYHFLIQYN